MSPTLQKAGDDAPRGGTGADTIDGGTDADLACHDAERVSFMNAQPLFRRTAEPPP